MKSLKNTSYTILLSTWEYLCCCIWDSRFSHKFCVFLFTKIRNYIINLFTNFIINQGLILRHLWYYCLELHLSIITQRKPSKFLILLNNLKTYLILSHKVIIILRQGYISTIIMTFIIKTLFHLVNDLLFS